MDRSQLVLARMGPETLDYTLWLLAKRVMESTSAAV
jgi:hypothetical protein